MKDGTRSEDVGIVRGWSALSRRRCGSSFVVARGFGRRLLGTAAVRAAGLLEDGRWRQVAVGRRLCGAAVVNWWRR